MQLNFDAVQELEPGAKWRSLFRRAWPGWRAWYLSRGGDPNPRLDEAERALRRYMPELEKPWRRLAELAGGGELAANFLSFWQPPAYLIHCSQAVLLHHDGPLLVRNYDLDPKLSEATVLCSAWTGRRVIATMEGIAGAADGINDAGLAVSLTFGGRQVVGRGFGIPIIIRYLLEVCERTADAVEVLRHVPSHMAYNVTIVDRAGTIATVYLSPDRPTIVTAHRLATNHQQAVEWPEQARFSGTLERERHLQRLLADPGLTPARMVAAFLEPPLFGTDYDRGFGTVYTAAYRPATAGLAMHWPGQQPWQQSCADFREGQRTVRYVQGASGAATRPRDPAMPAGELADLVGRQLGHAGRVLPEAFVTAITDALRHPSPAAWQSLAHSWPSAAECEQRERRFSFINH